MHDWYRAVITGKLKRVIGSSQTGTAHRHIIIQAAGEPLGTAKGAAFYKSVSAQSGFAAVDLRNAVKGTCILS